MDDSILFLIENTIKNNNEENIKKLSSTIDMDISQTKIFIKYFNKYNIFSSILDSKYANCINGINLKDLREKDDLTDQKFAKVISTFIKLKRKNKKWYYVQLKEKRDFNLEISILSQLDYKSFIYEIDFNYNLYSSLYDNLNIFTYIKNVFNYDIFTKNIYNIIYKQIDCPSLSYVSLDWGLDEIIQYSKKFQNRINVIYEYININQLDKVKQLLELNKESLSNYPHCNFDYLIPLKNAYYINLIFPKGKIDNEYDFTKITRVNILDLRNLDFIIDILNKCHNVEQLKFSTIPPKNLLYILENIKCPKIKEIFADCGIWLDYEDIKNDYDLSKIFNNMPLLEKLNIEEKTEYTGEFKKNYSVIPIFYSVKKRLAFPLLLKLIRNYLKNGSDRNIYLEFFNDKDFDEFWEILKDEKEILYRVRGLYVPSRKIFLDSYFEIEIDERFKTVDKIKPAKYYYCFVKSSFNENILEFIKKNKIEYLFILYPSKINLDELKKCNDLKFVFDKYNKIILFRNKNDNILETI